MGKGTFFGVDFYPTPKNIAEQMISETELFGKTILEPSAGSGNIVDVLKERGAEVIACEIDPRLRAILDRKCTIICDDFLKVTSDQISHVDAIVMNPPFSKAEEHILHAWEIAPEGCKIISLCNTNMLTVGGWSSRRKVRDLVKDFGLTDNYNSCFTDAERPTDCQISCITLWKPKTGAAEFDDYFDSSFGPDGDSGRTAGIMPYNSIRDIVNRYVEGVRMFDTAMDMSQRIKDMIAPFSSMTIGFGAYRRSGNNYDGINRQTYKNELQKAAWMHIFDTMNMSKYVTKSVREDINRYVERQVNVPFTMRNIFKMLELIVATHENRMKKTLTDAFDKICGFSAENSTAGEGWKTNSDYMINRRFIVPYMTDADYGGRVHLRYYGGNRDDMEDIIRALCFITGTPYENTISLRDFVNNNELEWGKWAAMGRFISRDEKDVNPKWMPGFFRIRAYKKGTMHFEFLDEDVWAKFNIEVARIRGWQLPKQRTQTKK